jgi:hypothetical protein
MPNSERDHFLPSRSHPRVVHRPVPKDRLLICLNSFREFHGILTTTHSVGAHFVRKVAKLYVMTSLDNGVRLNAKQDDTVARIMHAELQMPFAVSIDLEDRENRRLSLTCCAAATTRQFSMEYKNKLPSTAGPSTITLFFTFLMYTALYDCREIIASGSAKAGSSGVEPRSTMQLSRFSIVIEPGSAVSVCG